MVRPCGSKWNTVGVKITHSVADLSFTWVVRSGVWDIWFRSANISRSDVVEVNWSFHPADPCCAMPLADMARMGAHNVAGAGQILLNLLSRYSKNTAHCERQFTVSHFLNLPVGSLHSATREYKGFPCTNPFLINVFTTHSHESSCNYTKRSKWVSVKRSPNLSEAHTPASF